MTERGRKLPMEQWPSDLRIQEFPNAGDRELMTYHGEKGHNHREDGV
jgi:hypothetical protein